MKTNFDSDVSFLQDLPSKYKSIEYLWSLRESFGIICPICKGSSFWKASRYRRICIHCRYQATIKAGTALKGTRIPIDKFILGIWLIASRYGVNSLRLQQTLVLSHETAWLLLFRVRKLMSSSQKNKLSGRVEVCDTLLKNLHDSRSANDRNFLIALAVEIKNSEILFSRIQHIPNNSGAILENFVLENVELGSEIKTDEWPGYRSLGLIGYRHDHGVGFDYRDKLLKTPNVAIVANKLNEWLQNTYRNEVSRKYLQLYLNEFTYRLNNSCFTSEDWSLAKHEKLFLQLINLAFHCK